MAPRREATGTPRTAGKAGKGKKSTKSRAKNLPRSQAPKRTGRPPVAVDADQLTELARIGCTMPEMAAVLKVSVDTLRRRFATVIETAREEGKSSLRHAQWRLALGGDKTMLIWLGKQELGQSDKTDSRVSVEDLRQKSDADLEAEAKALGLA